MITTSKKRVLVTDYNALITNLLYCITASDMLPFCPARWADIFPAAIGLLHSPGQLLKRYRAHRAPAWSHELHWMLETQVLP